MVRYGMVRYGTVRYSMVRYGWYVRVIGEGQLISDFKQLTTPKTEGRIEWCQDDNEWNVFITFVRIACEARASSGQLRSYSVVVGTLPNPKNKSKRVWSPKKDYLNSNGKQSKRTERDSNISWEGLSLLSPFSQISVKINIFQQVKGRILSKLQYIFHPKLKKKKLKGSIVVPFLCNNSPSKQRQLWEYQQSWEY